MYKQRVDQVLNQEVSRKDFLKAGGAIIISLIGIPALINTITKAFSGDIHKAHKLGQTSSGYGARPYGR